MLFGCAGRWGLNDQVDVATHLSFSVNDAELHVPHSQLAEVPLAANQTPDAQHHTLL